VTWLTCTAIEGERTEGCPCCRCRLDLVAAIRLLVERPLGAQRILIVVDAGRDISTVNQTILSDPDLQRLVELDGVIATIDSVAASTRLAMGLPFADEPELQRIAVADRIVIARAIAVTDESLGAVMRAARTINRFGLITAPTVLPVDVESLVDIRAWHGAPTIAPDVLSEQVIVAADGELPMTVSCEVDGELDPEAIEEWFDQVIGQYGAQLLRLQGAVSVAGDELRVCCRGVRSYASSHSEADHVAGHRSAHNLVALVGYRLDAEALRSTFLATVAR
jgi:G3E family GTPase